MQDALSPRRERPPYWLGLLCLIPLIGAFVGLGLLLYGLIKYKDKWLSIIGAAGIAFTVFVYSSLFFFMNHSSIAKNGFEKISQMQLNQLVRYVEFYKLQYGYYPDSLRQIKEEDPLAPVEDPLQLNNGRGIGYNYKREGDRYHLSSSGEDGKSDTPDDLYPQVTIRDSTKIGWRK